MIDESNDPDINFFNDKCEAVDSPYFSVAETNSLILSYILLLGV